ncbi:trichohyalin isoform X2 [Nilaparvata lugens]|uniref:trichohyalin isoform X2 n=1 Tax=Nilaparvata lugens TaxID=108931 RepID=UPI00193DB2AE|nr:trichohyalin isoform X2 [Nilaparvata lugens]
MDIVKLCRLCGALLDSTEDDELLAENCFQMLKTLLNVEIIQNTSLAKKVCDNCVHQLTSFSVYRNKFFKTQSSFQTVLGEECFRKIPAGTLPDLEMSVDEEGKEKEDDNEEENNKEEPKTTADHQCCECQAGRNTEKVDPVKTASKDSMQKTIIVEMIPLEDTAEDLNPIVIDDSDEDEEFAYSGTEQHQDPLRLSPEIKAEPIDPDFDISIVKSELSTSIYAELEIKREIEDVSDAPSVNETENAAEKLNLSTEEMEIVKESEKLKVIVEPISLSRNSNELNCEKASKTARKRTGGSETKSEKMRCYSRLKNNLRERKQQEVDEPGVSDSSNLKTAEGNPEEEKKEPKKKQHARLAAEHSLRMKELWRKKREENQASRQQCQREEIGESDGNGSNTSNSNKIDHLAENRKRAIEQRKELDRRKREKSDKIKESWRKRRENAAKRCFPTTSNKYRYWNIERRKEMSMKARKQRMEEVRRKREKKREKSRKIRESWRRRKEEKAATSGSKKVDEPGLIDLPNLKTTERNPEAETEEAKKKRLAAEHSLRMKEFWRKKREEKQERRNDRLRKLRELRMEEARKKREKARKIRESWRRRKEKEAVTSGLKKADESGVIDSSNLKTTEGNPEADKEEAKKKLYARLAAEHSLRMKEFWRKKREEKQESRCEKEEIDKRCNKTSKNNKTDHLMENLKTKLERRKEAARKGLQEFWRRKREENAARQQCENGEIDEEEAARIKRIKWNEYKRRWREKKKAAKSRQQCENGEIVEEEAARIKRNKVKEYRKRWRDKKKAAKRRQQEVDKPGVSDSSNLKTTERTPEEEKEEAKKKTFARLAAEHSLRMKEFWRKKREEKLGESGQESGSKEIDERCGNTSNINKNDKLIEKLKKNYERRKEAAKRKRERSDELEELRRRREENLARRQHLNQSCARSKLMKAYWNNKERRLEQSKRARAQWEEETRRKRERAEKMREMWRRKREEKATPRQKCERVVSCSSTPNQPDNSKQIYEKRVANCRKAKERKIEIANRKRETAERIREFWRRKKEKLQNEDTRFNKDQEKEEDEEEEEQHQQQVIIETTEPSESKENPKLSNQDVCNVEAGSDHLNKMFNKDQEKEDEEEEEEKEEEKKEKKEKEEEQIIIKTTEPSESTENPKLSNQDVGNVEAGSDHLNKMFNKDQENEEEEEEEEEKEKEKEKEEEKKEKEQIIIKTTEPSESTENPKLSNLDDCNVEADSGHLNTMQQCETVDEMNEKLDEKCEKSLKRKEDIVKRKRETAKRIEEFWRRRIKQNSVESARQQKVDEPGCSEVLNQAWLFNMRNSIYKKLIKNYKIALDRKAEIAKRKRQTMKGIENFWRNKLEEDAGERLDCSMSKVGEQENPCLVSESSVKCKPPNPVGSAVENAMSRPTARTKTNFEMIETSKKRIMLKLVRNLKSWSVQRDYPPRIIERKREILRRKLKRRAARKNFLRLKEELIQLKNSSIIV